MIVGAIDTGCEAAQVWDLERGQCLHTHGGRIQSRRDLRTRAAFTELVSGVSGRGHAVVELMVAVERLVDQPACGAVGGPPELLAVGSFGSGFDRPGGRRDLVLAALPCQRP